MNLTTEFEYLSNLNLRKIIIVNYFLYLASIFVISQFVYHDQVYLEASTIVKIENVRLIDYSRYGISPFVFAIKTITISSFIYSIILLLNLKTTFKYIYKSFLTIYPLTFFGDFMYIYWFLVLSPSSNKTVIDLFYPLGMSTLIDIETKWIEFAPLLHFLNFGELLFGIVLILFLSFQLKIPKSKAFVIFFLGYLLPIVLFYLFLYILKQ